MIKKVIGYAIIVSLFGSIFFLAPVKVVLLAYAITAGVVVLLYIAAYLISDR